MAVLLGEGFYLIVNGYYLQLVVFVPRTAQLALLYRRMHLYINFFRALVDSIDVTLGLII